MENQTCQLTLDYLPKIKSGCTLRISRYISFFRKFLDKPCAIYVYLTNDNTPTTSYWQINNYCDLTVSYTHNDMVITIKNNNPKTIEIQRLNLTYEAGDPLLIKEDVLYV